jgi:hypothetical protein
MSERVLICVYVYIHIFIYTHELIYTIYTLIHVYMCVYIYMYIYICFKQPNRKKTKHDFKIGKGLCRHLSKEEVIWNTVQRY